MRRMRAACACARLTSLATVVELAAYTSRALSVSEPCGGVAARGDWAGYWCIVGSTGREYKREYGRECGAGVQDMSKYGEGREGTLEQGLQHARVVLAVHRAQKRLHLHLVRVELLEPASWSAHRREPP